LFALAGALGNQKLSKIQGTKVSFFDERRLFCSLAARSLRDDENLHAAIIPKANIWYAQVSASGGKMKEFRSMNEKKVLVCVLVRCEFNECGQNPSIESLMCTIA
jgi:hypothetical protein